MKSRREKRDRVIREAMVQLFALQLRLGTSIEEVNSLAQSSIRLASRSAIGKLDDVADADVYQFAGILRTWHRETRFLSKQGFPRRLAIEGRNSLKALVYAHYPKQQFDAVLNSLRRTGLIRRDRQGKWFPTARHAVFQSLSKELLTHFSEGVARFIETMTRNVETEGKEEVLFERSCKVARLPISAGPEFRNFVNGQAAAFLESVDDWLEGRAAIAKKSREKKCEAGVFAFAFMDDIPKRKR